MKKIIITITICCFILLINGCAWFENNQITVKPITKQATKINTNSREFRRMLAIMCKQHFKTEDYQTVDWIEADLYLAEYKSGID